MSEPRWLDEREARAWRGYRRMRDLLDLQVGRDLARETGLSWADYSVLVVLSEAPNHRMRLVDLAGQTLWSKSRLSHQLTRMQRRGLLRREECERHPENARATDAVLTTEGLRAIEAAAPRHVESVRRHLLDQLTDDQIDALGDITEQVVRHFRVDSEDDG